MKLPKKNVPNGKLGGIMDRDFNGYIPYMDFGMAPPSNSPDINEMYKDPMLNPMLQYEQACSYYRYLCMQMDYKIKCKEYEKMCASNANTNERSNRKIE